MVKKIWSKGVAPFGLMLVASALAAPVYAESCIRNSAGFVLKVKFLDENLKTVKTDVIPFGQKTCHKTATWVTLGVKDGYQANDAVKASIVVGAAVGAVGACAGTAGLACPAAAAGVSALIGMSADKIPDPKDSFAVARVDGKKDLEVKDTMWNPKVKGM